MILVASSFLMLSTLPYNFGYPLFAVSLFIMGIGSGMFGAPNIVSIMNSVPGEDRGVASGMRSMLQNSGMVVSMAMFFTIVIVSLSHTFPGTCGVPYQCRCAGSYCTDECNTTDKRPVRGFSGI